MDNRLTYLNGVSPACTTTAQPAQHFTALQRVTLNYPLMSHIVHDFSVPDFVPPCQALDSPAAEKMPTGLVGVDKKELTLPALAFLVSGERRSS